MKNVFDSIVGKPGNFYTNAAKLLRERHGLAYQVNLGPLERNQYKNEIEDVYRIFRGDSKTGCGLYVRALYNAVTDEFQFITCGSINRPHEKNHKDCIELLKKKRDDIRLDGFVFPPKHKTGGTK